MKRIISIISFLSLVNVFPTNATDKSASWTSDAESVASVSQEGSVKTLKAGTATTYYYCAYVTVGSQTVRGVEE